MGIRDYVLAAIIVACLPFCLLRPWIGVLVWSWLGYMNPHRLSWNLQNVPFAQMVAVCTLVGLIFTRERFPLPRRKELALLVLLWAMFLVSTVFAEYPEAAWAQLIKVSKILLMTVLTLVLFQDRRKLKALLWVITGSVAFFGVKGGLFAIFTGGNYQVLGPPGSFIEGNTEIGLALNMVLPLIFYMRREVTNRWLRHALLASFFLSIIAILSTYSRGALLTLAAVLFFLLLRSEAKAKAGILVLMLVSVPAAIALLPGKWFQRMETISTYEQDASAMGRITAWQLSYRLARQRPLVGFGFQPFTPEIYVQYMPEYPTPDRSADAHNIFLQVLAEHGFIGLLLYVALFMSTLLSLRNIIHKCRRDANVKSLGNFARMTEASLWAFLAGGFFLSRSYFDLYYHLIAITMILAVLVKAEQAKKVAEVTDPIPESIPAPAIVL